MRLTFDYEHLATLAAIVREGSFDRAAAALHVTPSAVSQRIKQLEEQVGQVLVVRAVPCRATSAGEALYRHAQQVALLEGDLAGVLAPRSVQTDAHFPTLAVAVNADSLATWFVAVAARCLHEHGLRLEIIVDDQNHTAEWLRSGRVLGAITSEATAIQGCQVEPLGTMRYRATASPAFVRRWFGDGVTRASIERAPVLVYDRKDRLEHRFVRVLFGRSRRELRWPAQWLPSAHGLVEACLRDMGWSVNPEPLIHPELTRGTLIDIRPGVTLSLPLYWQRWRLSSPTLALLSREVIAGVANVLETAPRRGPAVRGQ
jgi:LysR family transcriptional regulator (chromosome initiation inhibitor)